MKFPRQKTHKNPGYYEDSRTAYRESARLKNECFDCITGSAPCPRGVKKCEEQLIGRQYMKSLRREK
jgi:hypothetical protein